MWLYVADSELIILWSKSLENAFTPSSECSPGKIKFRRFLLRFERVSTLHYALKILAYTMTNLRHFCQG